VVARDGDHGDGGVAQAIHLTREVRPGSVVEPVSVEEIAGDQQRVGAFLDRQIDQVRERGARGEAELLDGCPVVAGEPAHRAVEVDVGCVDELHSELSILRLGPDGR